WTQSTPSVKRRIAPVGSSTATSSDAGSGRPASAKRRRSPTAVPDASASNAARSGSAETSASTVSSPVVAVSQSASDPVGGREVTICSGPCAPGRGSGSASTEAVYAPHGGSVGSASTLGSGSPGPNHATAPAVSGSPTADDTSPIRQSVPNAANVST